MNFQIGYDVFSLRKESFGIDYLEELAKYWYQDRYMESYVGIHIKDDLLTLYSKDLSKTIRALEIIENDTDGEGLFLRVEITEDDIISKEIICLDYQSPNLRISI